MEVSKKEHYRSLLHQQYDLLEKDLNLMKNKGFGIQDKYSPSELSNYDNHPADLGTELYMVEMNNALINHQFYQLREVENSLKRLDNGKYGTCESCGTEISEERLEALPIAKTCIECANTRAYDLDSLKKSRPVEESVIGYPFGRKSFEKRYDDDYEGLDQLNDLVKYGSSDSPQDMGGYEDYEEYYTNEIDRQGIVDPMDAISNEQYRRQLPG